MQREDVILFHKGLNPGQVASVHISEIKSREVINLKVGTASGCTYGMAMENRGEPIKGGGYVLQNLRSMG